MSETKEEESPIKQDYEETFEEKLMNFLKR